MPKKIIITLPTDLPLFFSIITTTTVSGFRVCKGMAFTSHSLQYTVVCKSSFGLPSQCKTKIIHIVNSANEIS